MPHVLLVEDNPGDIVLIQEAFEQAGIVCRLDVAPDGVVAMAMLRQEPPYSDLIRPDLILLDINMPKVSGHDVLAKLKSDPRLHSIPVVVLTSSTATLDTLKSYELHASAHICKPESLAEYAAMVRSIEQFWLRATLQQVVEERQIIANQSRLLSHSLATSENEQRHIARELHDGIAQSLASLQMGLQAALRAEDHIAAKATISKLLPMVTTALDEVRCIIGRLRPRVLDEIGLKPALDRLVQRTESESGVCVNEIGSDALIDEMSSSIETSLYRVVQESLNNVSQHANAKRVRIEWNRSSDKISLGIADDGCGFDLFEVESGSSTCFGLLGMRERVTLAGGTFDIRSAPGDGTQISVSIPIDG